MNQIANGPEQSSGVSYDILFESSLHALETFVDQSFFEILTSFADDSDGDDAIDQLSLNNLRNHLHSTESSAEYDSIAAILSRLLDEFRDDGLIRIRYYDYQANGSDGRLVSVDSAGHDEHVATQLRIGRIIKTLGSSPLSNFDSFWCIEFGVPFLFELDVNAPRQEPPVISANALPRIRTPFNHCDKVLCSGKCPYWIDIPLFVSGRCVGKLSCDIAPNSKFRFELTPRLLSLWQSAQAAAPHLTFLHRELFHAPLADVMAETNNCQSLDALLAYCTEYLPKKLFRAKYASFFSLSRDSLGNSKLILLKTSYPPAQIDELEKTYSLDDDSLTAWVARNDQSLRLHDLNGDPEEREQQLNAFRTQDPQLTWRNRIKDSDDHTSFLAVTIKSGAAQIHGVLRLTQKYEHNADHGHFTERDQRLLEAISSEVIGPRFVQLRQRERSPRLLFGHLQKANAISLLPTSNLSDIANAFGSAFVEFFPEHGTRKLFLFNLLDEGEDSFHHYISGGSLEPRSSQIYPLARSLTEYALQHESGVVFINDQFAAETQGAFHILSDKVRTALACRVCFLNKSYGVVVVKSDHYDLDPDKDGTLLEYLASEAGSIFARRERTGLESLRDLLSGTLDLTCPSKRETERIPSLLDATMESYSSQSPQVPEMTETNIEELLHRIVEQTPLHIKKDITIRCPAKNKTVLAYDYVLTTVLYNLLLFRAELRDDRHLRSTISADTRGNWLRVNIAFNSPSSRYWSRASACFKPDVFSSIGELHSNDLPSLRLSVSRNLAYWHQKNGFQRGSLRVRKRLDPDRVGFTLSVPVG